MDDPGNASLKFLFDFARQLNPNITPEEVERLAAIAAINTHRQQQQQQLDSSRTAAATAPAAEQHASSPPQQQQQPPNTSRTPPPLLPPTLQLQLPAAAAAAGAAVPLTPVHPHVSVAAHNKLSLEIGHSCLSSGCGDSSCNLCQHNESRRCKADLKQKYVTRDYIRSNCGAGLLIRLVDDKGQHFTQPLPGWKLQVCVIDAKRYKEINPTNMQLGFEALTPCILDKPLLRWENGSETAVVTLPVEYGQVHLPELQCFSITGEHRAGKACDYRLAFWIQNRNMLLPRVSEPFTVVCLRSRAAVKSEVPLSEESVGRLEGIGEQAVSTLKTLGQQLGPGSGLPAELCVVDKVGQFCDLVRLVQSDSQLEKKLMPLFKKADWKKATQHAASTVFPDYRPRVWWCPHNDSEDGRIGLLFRCENAVVQVQRPFAWVQRLQAAPSGHGTLRGPMAPDEIRVFAHPGQQEQQAIQLAAQDWDSPQHGNWSIYWLDPADPLAQQSLNPSSPMGQTLGLSSNPEHLPYGVLAAAGIVSPASGRMQNENSTMLAAAVAATAAAATTANTSSSAVAAGVHGSGLASWLVPQPQELQTQQQLADLHLAQQLVSIQQQQHQPSPFFFQSPPSAANGATITTGAVLPQQQQEPMDQQQQQLPWGGSAGCAVSEAMAVAHWLSGSAAAPAAPALPMPPTDPLAAAAAAALAKMVAAAAAGNSAVASTAAAGQTSSPGGSSSTLPSASCAAAAMGQRQQDRQPVVSMFSPPAGLMEQMPPSLRGEVQLTDTALKAQQNDPLSVSMTWIPDHLAEDFPDSLVPGVVQMRSLCNGTEHMAPADSASGCGGRGGGNSGGQQHGLRDSYSLPLEILNSAVWKSVMPPDAASAGSLVLRDVMALADSLRGRQRVQQVQQQQQQHDQDHDGDVDMTSAALVDLASLSELERTVLENISAVAAQGRQMPPSLLKSDSLLGSEQERLLQECNQALRLKQLNEQLQQQQQHHHQFTGWHR